MSQRRREREREQQLYITISTILCVTHEIDVEQRWMLPFYGNRCGRLWTDEWSGNKKQERPVLAVSRGHTLFKCPVGPTQCTVEVRSNINDDKYWLHWKPGEVHSL